jgi:hypothetical protein
LWLNAIPGADYIFLGIIVLFLVAIVRHGLSSNNKSNSDDVESSHKENCCENGHVHDNEGGCCGKH